MEAFEPMRCVPKSHELAHIDSFSDTVGITQEALRNHYRTHFCRIYPFPWSETIHASIRDIFAPLDIVDSNG